MGLRKMYASTRIPPPYWHLLALLTSGRRLSSSISARKRLSIYTWACTKCTLADVSYRFFVLLPSWQHFISTSSRTKSSRLSFYLCALRKMNAARRIPRTTVFFYVTQEIFSIAIRTKLLRTAFILGPRVKCTLPDASHVSLVCTVTLGWTYHLY